MIVNCCGCDVKINRKNSEIRHKNNYCSKKCLTNHKLGKRIGERFGKIVLLSWFKKGRLVYYKCKCDCGTIKDILINSITRIDNRTNSCGCFQKEKARKNPGDSGFTALYHSYKAKAKCRDVCFELSKNQFKTIVQSCCIYCGQTPKQIFTSHNFKNEDSYEYSAFIYNGIDRVDSNDGYNIKNSVPCCGRCNEGKMDISKDEFLLWIKRVYENNKLENYVGVI